MKKSFVAQLSILVLFILLVGCQNGKKEKKKLIGERAPYKNLTKVKFAEKMYDFGNIKAGDTVNHYFVLENVGTSNLKIEDVSSSCGCTIPSWPRKEIFPHQKDSIKVLFTKKNELGEQIRDVIVRANTQPEYNIMKIRVNLISKN